MEYGGLNALYINSLPSSGKGGTGFLDEVGDVVSSMWRQGNEGGYCYRDSVGPLHGDNRAVRCGDWCVGRYEEMFKNAYGETEGFEGESSKISEVE